MVAVPIYGGQNPLKYDPYEILEIPRGAAIKDIKKAYRRLAQRYHPDVNPFDPLADRIFSDINEAYRTLMEAKQKQLKYQQPHPRSSVTPKYSYAKTPREENFRSYKWKEEKFEYRLALQLTWGMLGKPLSTIRYILKERPQRIDQPLLLVIAFGLGWAIPCWLTLMIQGLSGKEWTFDQFLFRNLIFGLLLTIPVYCGLLIFSTLLDYGARRLGGRCSDIWDIYLIGSFAFLPLIFILPTQFVWALIDPLKGKYIVAGGSCLATFAFILWSMSLFFLGIREVYHLERGKSLIIVTTVFSPLIFIIFLLLWGLCHTL